MSVLQLLKCHFLKLDHKFYIIYVFLAYISESVLAPFKEKSQCVSFLITSLLSLGKTEGKVIVVPI